MFVPLLVAALNAGQRLQLFIGLSDGGSVRLEETVITAQDCHDRHALLCRTLEVVTDDVRVALLQLFSTRGLPREDGQEGLVRPTLDRVLARSPRFWRWTYCVSAPNSFFPSI